MRAYQRVTVREARPARPGGIIGLIALVCLVAAGLNAISHTLAVAVGVLAVVALIAAFLRRSYRRNVRR